MTTLFDPKSEVQRLRESSTLRRKHSYRKSRLDKFAGELTQLYQAGANTAELQRWLRENRIVVEHSTVARWLKKHGQVR